MYIGSHQPDLRSEALGFVGLYYLGSGDQKTAFRLWEAADDGFDIDEAIARVAKSAVSADPSNLDGAIALVDLINSKTIRAKTLSELSRYA